jgi:tetratricopeptide (TPR) repeat protein
MWDINSINIYDLIKDPVFILIATALGAVLGYFIKALADIWTAEVKRREDVADHVKDLIEKYAPTYYLLSNHAFLLSDSLNDYIESKCLRQMFWIPSETELSDPSHPAHQINDLAESNARTSLFEAAKLYAVMTNCFWNVGGVYILPDRWANSAITYLHNQLMSVFHFKREILLQYIDEKTTESDFYIKLKDSEINDCHEDLRKSFQEFREWILNNDTEVKKAAAYAQAYSNLFSNQMTCLYKEWYDRGLVLKPTDDPLKAREVTSSSSELYEETREIIRQSTKEFSQKYSARSQLFLRNIKGSPDLENADIHFEQGWRYYIGRQYDMAIEEYEKALVYDPDNAMIYNNLGNVYASKHEFEKCTETFDKSIEMFDKARIEYDIVLKSHSRNPVFKKIIDASERFTRIFAKYVKENRAPFAYVYTDLRYRTALWNAGYLYYQAGEAVKNDKEKYFDKSISYFKKGIVFDNSHRSFHTGLGLSYISKGKINAVKEDFDNAIEAFHKAIDLMPSDPDSYGNLARALYHRGNIEAALWADQKAIDLSIGKGEQQALYYNWLGIILEKQDKRIEANDAYRKAVDLNPSDPVIRANLADTLYNQEMYDEALQNYQKAIDLSIGKGEQQALYYNWLGIILEIQDKWIEAIDAYREAVERASENRVYADNLIYTWISHNKDIDTKERENLIKSINEMIENLSMETVNPVLYSRLRDTFPHGDGKL